MQAESWKKLKPTANKNKDTMGGYKGKIMISELLLFSVAPRRADPEEGTFPVLVERVRFAGDPSDCG